MLNLERSRNRRVAAQVLLLCVAIVISVGCGEPVPRLQWVPNPVDVKTPVANIAEGVRVENWVGNSPEHGSGGSCVHASSINVFQGAGREDLSQLWRARRYEGPETGNGILSKYKAEGIPHLWTETADTKLLEQATATHRTGIIFYFPGHCVEFVEFAQYQGREVAVLLDNNFVDRYFLIDRPTFERSWKYYDGFAAVPWIEPVTPRTFPRTVPLET